MVYFAATSRDNIDALASLADGAAYPAVRPDAVLGTHICSPDTQILDAFEAFAAPILESMSERAEQSRTLGSLRDTLLPKLISEELHIADAEQQIAAA